MSVFRTISNHTAYNLVRGCVLAIVVGGGTLGLASRSGDWRAVDSPDGS